MAELHPGQLAHNNSTDQFSFTDLPKVYVFGQQEKVKVPGVNPHWHMENMHTL